jgi:hypothetical protein
MIRNPFVKEEIKKKPNFKSVYDEGVDTEAPKIQPPSIILDGGRYTIYIKETETAKAAGERLLDFFHILEGRDKQKMATRGVAALPSSPEEPEEGFVILRYGPKMLSIYVGEDKSPESAYRRLGFAIQGLGPHVLLKKYGITIVERA